MSSRGRWLVIALALFALLYALAPRTDRAPRATRPAMDFPNTMRPQDYERLAARQTLAPFASAPDAAVEVSAYEAVKRDPLLVALPPDPDTAIVLEAKTFLSSPAGKLLIECVSQGETPTLEDEGFTYESLDRVAFALSDDGRDHVMFLTGSITEQAPEIAALREHTASPYGSRGQFLERTGDERATATWNGEMMMIGSSRASLEQAIDRLEGRATVQPPIEETQSYGDIYGRLSSRAMREILQEAIPDLTLDESLELDFHVDTNKDVLLVLNAAGQSESTRDLGKTLGAAIAARRVQASLDDDQQLAELLDYFKVDTDLGWFSLNAALPLAFVEDALQDCTRRARERRKAKAKIEATGADGGALE